MKITMLGSGTSTGIPVIGCKCEVCTSADPYDNRLRASVLVENDGYRIVVDTSTDFRQQALRFGIDHIDAVFYTHAHADHIFGIDELRMFNLRQQKAIPCYGSVETINQLKSFFPYIFETCENVNRGFRPSVDPVTVKSDFPIFGMNVTPVEVSHGNGGMVLGYRFNDAAYLTDCKSVSPESAARLHGLRLLILGAVRYKPHFTHFNLDEALELIEQVRPARTYLTNLSHAFSHRGLTDSLPPGVFPAYDGLCEEIPG